MFHLLALPILDLLLEHLPELDFLALHPCLHELCLQAVLLGRPRVLYTALEATVELNVHRVWGAPLPNTRWTESYFLNATFNGGVSPD